MSAPSRLAPLSGVAAIGCIVIGLALDSAPTASWPSDRISAWYADHSLGHWFVSAFVLALGAPLFLVFVSDVLERMRVAQAPERLRTLALTSGTAFAVTVLVGAGLYVAVPAAMTFAKAPAPSADVSRFFLGAAYGVIVMFSALSAALFTAVVSASSLRHAVLPRAIAVVGLPASLLMLLNAVMPMAVITLWFVAASIGLSLSGRRAAAVRTPEPQPAVV